MRQLRLLAGILTLLILIASVLACGRGDSEETSETGSTSTTTNSQSSTPAANPEPTEAPPPTEASEVLAATAEPTAAPPQPTPTTAPAAPPAPEPTATSAPTSDAITLEQYAAEHAGGPGAIFVGDPTQLIGLPPHEGLMFDIPEQQYLQAAGASLFGVPALEVPGHMFIYTSDYYQGLLEKANLTNPTPLTSSGESIEIQHVCIDRNLPACVLIQTYFAPNLAERTNGQVDLKVSSFVELGLAGPDTLSQVGDGSLDMVNIYTGYISGAHPAVEVQSLWGMPTNWEESYLGLTGMAPEIDAMLLEFSGGSPVLNRNWFAGSDQWFFSSQPMATVDDFDGLKIRTHAASMSDFIRGMGADPVQISLPELYISMQLGTVDAAVTTVILGVTGRLHEVSEYIAGPLIGFGYTNNVINQDVWNRIPADLQQIMIEEGAKTELEALRLAPVQNLAAVELNKRIGLQPIPFSPEIQEHIRTFVLPKYVIPGWLKRLGYPGSGAEAVAIYNEKVAPYSGLIITEDGSIEPGPITKGPNAP